MFTLVYAENHKYKVFSMKVILNPQLHYLGTQLFRAPKPTLGTTLLKYVEGQVPSKCCLTKEKCSVCVFCQN